MSDNEHDAIDVTDITPPPPASREYRQALADDQVKLFNTSRGHTSKDAKRCPVCGGGNVFPSRNPITGDMRFNCDCGIVFVIE